MAITKTWDNAVPSGGADPKQLDTFIQDSKTATYERFRNGGHKCTNSAADSEDGRHVIGQEFDSGGASAVAHEFYVYDNDGSTKRVTIKGTSHGTNPLEVDATGMTVKGTNITSGDSPGHTHNGTIAIALPGGATGVQAGVYFENRSTQTLDILGGKLVCGTAPSGTALTVQVYRLATGYTNPGSGGTAVFSAAPTVTAGNRVGSESTSLDAAQDNLAQGDALYFDITALSSAADIVLYLRVRKA